MEELANALGKSKSYVSKVLKVLSLDDEIIQDLSRNKSTNDIESLYEIQKIENKKDQIKTYFDFISKKIDRKDIREKNRKKVSHAKTPYSFGGRAKKVKVEFDVSDLTDDMVNRIKNEIEEVLKKYLA
jgi:ParB-like chromosome segregation protein Spo0J